VLDIRLGLSCSIIIKEVYKALSRSYSLRACKKKWCYLVVNVRG